MQSPTCRLAASVAAVCALALCAGAQAQYFGRNKVQYDEFDWRILKTEHFDIHYYPEEERAVRDAARMAERWYDRLRQVFGFDLSERRAIILYADASDFQQTTVIGGLIGQGTGGVTESLRTRVVMPLAGTYAETDHVLGHELVHVFQYEILLGRRPGVERSRANLPLWFVEGLAEYLTIGRQAPQAATWLRDAVLRDDLPDLRALSRNPRYFPYRWGHAFWAYVGGRFGDSAIGPLFTAGSEVGVETALQEVVKLKHEDFSQQWRASIREAYQPDIERRTPPGQVGRAVFADQRGRQTDVAPVASPDGRQLIFLSTRGLFSFDLYLADARTGEIQERLVSSDSDAHFDALRFLDSAGSWSPDGAKVVFAVFARGDNELAIVDVASRRIERRLPMPGVGAIWNPSWSPDGRTIAFSGAAGGISDLYLLDLASGEVRRLTDDPYADLQPDWAPDGRSLVFASDRGPGTDLQQLVYAPMNLWRIDLATRQVAEALPGAGRGADPAAGERFNPQLSPDGRTLYFLEVRDGVSDVFRGSVEGGDVERLTRAGTGVTGITETSPALSVADRTGEVLFTVFDDTGYRIRALPAAPPAEPALAITANAGTLPPVRPERPSIVTAYLGEASPAAPVEADVQAESYRSRLQLDYVAPAGGVAYTSFGYAVGGELTAVFGDMLGERRLGFTLSGTGGGGSFNEIGVQGLYLNQENRWNWGVEAGHVPIVSGFTQVSGTLVDVGDGQVAQGRLIEQLRQTVTLDQAGFVTQYPFSTTRRFEATIGATQLGYDLEVFRYVALGNTIVERSEDDLPAPESLRLYQGSAALVGDSSFFGFTSPVRGRRYRLEVEPTFGDLEFQTLLGDYRRYFFFRPVTLAARGLHLGRYGSDAESNRLAPLFVGEETLVRGYGFGSFDGSECSEVPGDPTACPEFDRLVGSRMGIINLELRLPLFGTEELGLVELPFFPTELSAFVDVGVAWDSERSPDLRFERDSIDRVPVVSAGVAARILLGGFAVVQVYAAKPFQRPDEDWVTGFLIAPGW
jgi:Tol biopolymer transport system component